MGMIFNMMLLVHIFSLLVFAASGQNECTVTRCNHDGPIIRFPFRTKDQPEHCGYPGFQLYCDIHAYNSTVLEFEYQANTSHRGLQLSFSVKAFVLSIDYTLQRMEVNVYHEKNRAKLQQLLNPQNSTLFEAEVVSYKYNNYYLGATRNMLSRLNYPEFTYLNCSATTKGCSYSNFDYILDKMSITSLNGHTDFGELYAIISRIKTFQAPLKSCTKMYNVSLVPYNFLSTHWFSDTIFITWATPNCSYCEAKGQHCKRKNNTGIKHGEATTECFPKGHGSPDKAILAGKIGGPFFILLLLVALYYVIKTYKQKKEGQLKIEMFLADYKALKPARYSYADIKKITNQFKEKLGQGGYGSVYKGQLSSDVLVAVKVLNSADSKGNGEEFINEVSSIGLIHHVNVVRLVGYCADGSSRALI